MPDARESRPSWQRAILLAFGCIFVAVGVVGLFLPLLPGTVFLIAAAACFARSSPQFELWLLKHPTLGPPVRSWRAYGAIPRRVKWIACASLAVSWIVIAASDAPAAVAAGCLVLFLAVAAYLVTRPEGSVPP